MSLERNGKVEGEVEQGALRSGGIVNINERILWEIGEHLTNLRQVKGAIGQLDEESLLLFLSVRA